MPLSRESFAVVPMDFSDPKGLAASLRLAFANREEQDRELTVQEILERDTRNVAAFPMEKSDFDGSFIALRGTTLLGALFSQLRPDGTITLCPPSVSEECGLIVEEIELVRRSLFERFDHYCTENGIPAAIVFCEQDSEDENRELLESGFEPLSELLQLVAEQRCFPIEPGRNDLIFVSCDERLKEIDQSRLNRELYDLAERTYAETLDFPRLNGLMAIEKIFQAYREEGDFRDDLWFFIYRQEHEKRKEVGLLLLTDQLHAMQLNLTYMGLVPEERGRKLGSQLVQYTLWKARSLARRWVLVSLDGANAPALHSYLRNGFRHWTRKTLFVKFYA